MIDSYEKLYFAVMSCNKYIDKGMFDYVSKNVEKDEDVAHEFKQIRFVDEKKVIQIYQVKVIAQNVKKDGLLVSYSAINNDYFIKAYKFNELVESEYWELINQKYKFNEQEYKKYKDTYSYEDKDTIENEFYFNSTYIRIRYNKLDGYLSVISNNENISFDGYLYDFVAISNDELSNYKQKEKLIDLMGKHKVQLLKNGFVIDDEYYEELDYYHEKVKDVE